MLQIPFAYHDGYLSVHFEAHKYQDIKLTPLQEEAVWYVPACWMQVLVAQLLCAAPQEQAPVHD